MPTESNLRRWGLLPPPIRRELREYEDGGAGATLADLLDGPEPEMPVPPEMAAPVDPYYAPDGTPVIHPCGCADCRSMRLVPWGLDVVSYVDGSWATVAPEEEAVRRRAELLAFSVRASAPADDVRVEILGDVRSFMESFAAASVRAAEVWTAQFVRVFTPWADRFVSTLRACARDLRVSPPPAPEQRHGALWESPWTGETLRVRGRKGRTATYHWGPERLPRSARSR